MARELVFRKAGRSSIDITRTGADKAACLKDLIRSQNLSTGLVYYFGDEFFPGGNDEPVALDPALQDINVLAFNQDKAPAFKHLLWAGKSVASAHALLSRL